MVTSPTNLRSLGWVHSRPAGSLPPPPSAPQGGVPIPFRGGGRRDHPYFAAANSHRFDRVRSNRISRHES